MAVTVRRHLVTPQIPLSFCRGVQIRDRLFFDAFWLITLSVLDEMKLSLVEIGEYRTG